MRSCAKSRTASWIASWVSFNSIGSPRHRDYAPLSTAAVMSYRQPCRVLHAFQGEMGIHGCNAGKMQQYFLQKMLIGIDASDHDPDRIVTLSAHREAFHDFRPIAGRLFKGKQRVLVMRFQADVGQHGHRQSHDM